MKETARLISSALSVEAFHTPGRTLASALVNSILEQGLSNKEDSSSLLYKKKHFICYFTFLNITSHTFQNILHILQSIPTGPPYIVNQALKNLSFGNFVTNLTLSGGDQSRYFNFLGGTSRDTLT